MKNVSAYKMEGSAVNIYDIAKLAGVSIATVSRVVNDSPKVSEKTKEKVRRVMEENSYTPNAFARGLRLDTMHLVGIVCPDAGKPHMAVMISGLEKNLGSHGYGCILACSGYGTEEKQKAIEEMLQRKIDALILIGAEYADGRLAGIGAAAKELPVFLLNGCVENKDVYCVFPDEFQAVYDVTQELLMAGRKKILFLGNAGEGQTDQCRGYEAALEDCGCAADERLVIESERGILAARDQLFKSREQEFDAVIAADDSLAAGALKFAAVKGWKVPEEVCIVGFYNSELAVSCEPELSSVDNRAEAVCRIAVEQLMAVFAGEAVLKRRKLKCHLEKRGTTDF